MGNAFLEPENGAVAPLSPSTAYVDYGNFYDMDRDGSEFEGMPIAFRSRYSCVHHSTYEATMEHAF